MVESHPKKRTGKLIHFSMGIETHTREASLEKA